jgi:peptidoglycan hydrolase-like amidase
LWKPEGVVQFVSYEENYNVYAGEELKGVLEQTKIAFLKYEAGVYSYKGGDLEFTSSQYLRLAPVNNPHAVFTLYNFSRQVSWKGPKNFNKYRGAMEYRLTQDGKDLYVINDLFLEDYVAGDSETSNASPIEYIKAMQVAYRTYAYYIKEHTDKHDKRNFDVVANTGDQLYLGYVSEELMPRVLQAAQETRGYMVTYNHDIVITPYYANSDGRTRAWTEVWGGSAKPWLVSVKAEYDQGRKMLGHGVGMSARDAAYRAEAGVAWQEIIKHYYSGVEIEKIYN